MGQPRRPRPCRRAGSAARPTRPRPPSGPESRPESRGQPPGASPSAGSRASSCRRSESRRLRPSRAALRCSRGRRREIWAAVLVQAAEPAPEPVDLALDQCRAFAVALAGARNPLEAHRLAPGDRDRLEVAQLPELRPVDRRRHDRDVLLERDHRRPGHRLARQAVLLARPLDEEPERVAVTHDLAHRTDGLAVRLAAPNRAGAERADQLTEPDVPVDLALRDVVDRPRAGRTEGGWVDPREVVHREHDATLERDALGAVVAERRDELDERLDRVTADRPDRVDVAHAVGWRSRTSASIRSTTSVTSSSLVSISSASAAGCMRARSLSSLARRSVASASAPMSGRSAWRRCSRTPRSATR